jgi:outer membrane protein OmpA-like peptidoglycan-associated protein
MKKVLLLCIFCILPLSADFNRTSGLVDIPTADILPHFGIRAGIDGSVGFQDTVDENEVNLHFSMGLFDIVEAYLDIYTFSDFTAAMGFCHRFYSIDKFGFAWGLHTISYDLDVSELGRGDTVGWFDDLMYNDVTYEKPFELGSAFLVATYSINDDFDATLGIGRGRYVGYGTHSKYFNTNAFRDEGGDWGIGLIAGMEVRFLDQFRFMLDADGRDFNVGLGYRYMPVEFNISLSKIEWFLWSDGDYKPRLSASVSYLNIHEEKGPGAIAGKVFDELGNPVVAEVGFVSDTVASVVSNPGSGVFNISPVDPGSYEIYAHVPGYQTARRKLRVRGGRTAYQEFKLQPDPIPPANIHGKVVEVETGRPLIVDLTVVETGYKTKSDSLGVFDIPGLSPGMYKIQADAIGFETGLYPVVLEASDKHVLDIKMLKPSDVIRLYGINFEFNKAVILPESYPIIDEAAAIIMNHPHIKVEIQGHTDGIGGAEYNLQLSYMRANAVRDYLIEMHEISPERLYIMAYGESRPVAPNTDEQGRYKNRRVEFFIIK